MREVARPKAIGLTGGIGSGKSTVARMLATLGAHVINADTVGHEVYAPGTAGWQRVTGRFGEEILGEAANIDRRKLGAIVFADPQALRDLNAIVHPLIGAEIERRVRAYGESGATIPVVIEAAILLEANWTTLVDQIWVVCANAGDVVERVRAERGMAEEQTRARIRAQLSDAERRNAADVVLENNGTLAELEARVRDAWRQHALA